MDLQNCDMPVGLALGSVGSLEQPTKRDVSPIERAFNNWDRELNRLENSIKGLYDKLQPIISEAPYGQEADKNPSTGGELARNINQRIEIMKDMTNRLNHLRDCLDL